MRLRRISRGLCRSMRHLPMVPARLLEKIVNALQTDIIAWTNAVNLSIWGATG